MLDVATRQLALAKARRQRTTGLFGAFFFGAALLLSGVLNEPDNLYRSTAVGIAVIGGAIFLVQAMGAHLQMLSVTRGEDLDPHILSWIASHQTLSDRDVSAGSVQVEGVTVETEMVRAAILRLHAKNLIAQLAPDPSFPEIAIWTLSPTGAREVERLRAQERTAAQ